MPSLEGVHRFLAILFFPAPDENRDALFAKLPSRFEANAFVRTGDQRDAS